VISFRAMEGRGGGRLQRWEKDLIQKRKFNSAIERGHIASPKEGKVNWWGGGRSHRELLSSRKRESRGSVCVHSLVFGSRERRTALGVLKKRGGGEKEIDLEEKEQIR